MATLTTGDTIFTDQGATTPADDGTYSNGTTQWTQLGGVVTLQQQCSSLTDEVQLAEDCRYLNPLSYYIFGTLNDLGSGDVIYADLSATTAASDGTYSNGTTQWTQSSSVITGKVTCVSLINIVSLAVDCQFLNPSTYYTYPTLNNLITGDTIFTDENATTPAADGTYSDGTTNWTMSSGTISLIVTCISLINAVELAINCEYLSTTTYYIYPTLNELEIGDIIYDDEAATTVASDGVYSDSNNIWVMTSGSISDKELCVTTEVQLSEDCRYLNPSSYYIYGDLNTLAIGSRIYNDAAATLTAPDGTYSDATTQWTMLSGFISAKNTCSSLINTVSLAVDCQFLNPGTYYTYPTLNNLITGDTIYSDVNATTVAPDGTYSDGTTNWTMASGAISSIDTCISLINIVQLANDCEFLNPTTYYTYPTLLELTIGDIIYNDAAATSTAIDGIYSDGDNHWTQTTGTIVSSGVCTTTEVQLASDCQYLDTSSYYIYGTLNDLDVGNVIYTDVNATTVASDGDYSSGDYTFTMVTGTISAKTECITTQVQLSDDCQFLNPSDYYIYGALSGLTTGDIIYSDSAATSAVSDNEYSDGDYIYVMFAGNIIIKTECIPTLILLSDSCDYLSPTNHYYYKLQTGYTLYTDSGATIVAVDDDYSDGTTSYVMSGGVITEINECILQEVQLDVDCDYNNPSSYYIYPDLVDLNIGDVIYVEEIITEVQFASDCTGSTSPYYIKGILVDLDVTEIIYSDTGATVTASDGNYVNASKIWTQSGGTITTISLCASEQSFADNCDYISPSTYYIEGPINDLDTGDVIYTDYELTTAAADKDYSNASKIWTQSGGVITAITICTINSIQLDDSCEYLSPSTYYILGSVGNLDTGQVIYTDSGATVPAADGFYSNGTNHWTMTSGVISSDGVCTTTQVQLDVCTYNSPSAYYIYGTFAGLAVGNVIYTDSGATTTASDGNYSDGTNLKMIMTSGVITQKSPCFSSFHMEVEYTGTGTPSFYNCDATLISGNIYHITAQLGKTVDMIVGVFAQKAFFVNNVTFYKADHLTTLQSAFEFWNVSYIDLRQVTFTNITRMDSAFAQTPNLTTVSFPNANSTQNVTNFNVCFTNSGIQNLPAWNTSNGTGMLQVFDDCSSLTCITNIDTRVASNPANIFRDCPNLVQPDAAAQILIGNGATWTNAGGCP